MSDNTAESISEKLFARLRKESEDKLAIFLWAINKIDSDGNGYGDIHLVFVAHGIELAKPTPSKKRLSDKELMDLLQSE